jgi:hypothetical protein
VYIDEVVADGWHYYHHDLRDLPSHEFVRMAEMLPSLLETDINGRVLSTLYAAVEMNRPHDDEREDLLLNVNEFSGDVAVVSV